MSKLNTTKLGIIIIFLVFIYIKTAYTQQPERYNAADIQLALKKLNVLGSALYIAAHPDDENTRLIGYLSNGALMNTAYLSMTRGDGGQNLVGPEIREALGLIRTHELIQARKIDGGAQFFTRANDFGYSKHPDETFKIWDKEAILADVVWAIRRFRPDVIITRFSTEPGRTHGHHTASAILAREAFDMAGDSTYFPEQLAYVDVWQPERLFWNTSWWFYGGEDNFDKTGLLQIDVGAYNALLGKSYTEIAAESRSMHKSQGFGSAGRRGSTIEYLQLLEGSKPDRDIFEGINTSWSRIRGGEAVGDILQAAYDGFDPERPDQIVPQLLKARKVLQSLSDQYWKKRKLAELDQVIKACLGLYLEVVAADYTATPGEAVSLAIEAVNRSALNVLLEDIQTTLTGNKIPVNHQLINNEVFSYQQEILIPEDAAYSQPYWLKEEGSLGAFSVKDQLLRGLPENPSSLTARFVLIISGERITYEVPVVYKRTDPVAGEVYRPFEITPPVFVNIPEKVYMFTEEKPKAIELTVMAGKADINGELRLQLGKGWRSVPASVPFSLVQKGEMKNIVFTIYPPEKESVEEVKAILTTGETSYNQSLVRITYDHIPKQILLPEASAKLVKVNIVKHGKNVGYIMGAGDQIPASLEQIGYVVNILDEHDMSQESLQKYDAIILGIRAYNTVDWLKFHQKKLIDYVREGGTMIVQYNTSFRLVMDDIAPYPLHLSRDRVAVEEAKVDILSPGHPVLNTPNKITDGDFEGWVQERGLYFPDQWDENFTAVFSTNDPGESPKKGGLLVASYGKGNYIYTGFSWFRQLPAGVPGAYRIFTNLISIGKEGKGIR